MALRVMVSGLIRGLVLASVVCGVYACGGADMRAETGSGLVGGYLPLAEDARDYSIEEEQDLHFLAGKGSYFVVRNVDAHIRSYMAPDKQFHISEHFSVTTDLLWSIGTEMSGTGLHYTSLPDVYAYWSMSAWLLINGRDVEPINDAIGWDMAEIVSRQFEAALMQESGLKQRSDLDKFTISALAVSDTYLHRLAKRREEYDPQRMRETRASVRAQALEYGFDLDAVELVPGKGFVHRRGYSPARGSEGVKPSVPTPRSSGDVDGSSKRGTGQNDKASRAQKDLEEYLSNVRAKGMSPNQTVIDIYVRNGAVMPD